MNFLRQIDVILQDGSLVLTNKSNKKVLIRNVVLHYRITAITVEGQRTARSISEERKIEKELKPNEKIQIQNILPEIKMVSVIYTVDDRTVRDDIEI